MCNRPQLFATSASHGGCWLSTALQHALKAVNFANPFFPQIRWTTLEHSGVLFPPEYQPHGVKMLYGESEWGVEKGCMDDSKERVLTSCAILGPNLRSQGMTCPLFQFALYHTDGVPVDLTPEQEEVATFYAVMLETGMGVNAVPPERAL